MFLSLIIRYQWLLHLLTMLVILLFGIGNKTKYQSPRFLHDTIASHGFATVKKREFEVGGPLLRVKPVGHRIIPVKLMESSELFL